MVAALCLLTAPAAGDSTEASHRTDGYQEAPTVEGRVVLGRDSTPVPGVEVALHGIADEGGGVVDRDTTGDDGRFLLRVAAPADTVTRLYLAATRYRGVLYFGRASAGRVRAAASLPPGPRRVSVQYTLPRDETVILPTRHPVERLEVLVQGEGSGLTSAALSPAGPVRFRDSVYVRYTAADLQPGTRVEFVAGGPDGGAGLLPWLFAGAGVLLLAAALYTWRLRGTQQGGGSGPAAGLAALAAVAAGAAAPTLAAAEAPTATPGDTIRIPDDRGDTLELARPAERVVSLIPAATEVVFALGAGHRLVGRTRYGTHPPAAQEVPSVGEGIRPSAEAVIARRPDAVVVYAGQANSASIRRFEELGVPVLALEHNTIPQLMRNIARLGRLTGREAAADSLAAAVREGLETVAGVVEGRRRVPVYYDLWPDPPRTVGGGSYLDSLITVAGGRNVFGDLEGPAPRVSLETVVERQPEVIVSPRGGGGERLPPGERPGWGKLRAVEGGRVVTVDGELMDRLGPRLGEAAAHLAAALHPTAADTLRALDLLPPDRAVGSGPRSGYVRSPPASATTCGAPSSGPGPGWRTTRTGHR